MKKILFISFLFFTQINAYEVGDKIEDSVAIKLNLGEGVNIIDVFASWCVSCKKELPLLNKLSKSLNEKEVKFIGIDTDEEVEEGLAFQKKLGLEFFILNDKNQEVVSKFNPIGMPAIYYVKNKKVIKKIFGAIDNIDEVIKKDLREMK